MTELKSKRNLWLNWVVQLSLDILIVNFLAFKLLDFGDDRIYFFSYDFLNNKYLLFIIYSSIAWTITSLLAKFYQISRHSSGIAIMTLLLKQILAFSISIYAFIGIFRSIDIDATLTFKYLLIAFLAIAVIKLLRQFIFKKLGLYLEGGIKQIVIAGYDQSSEELESLVTQKKELGYELKGTFSNSEGSSISGNIADAIKFIKSSDDIDEVYCAIDQLSEDEVNDFVKLASMNDIELKFIANTESYYAKKLETNYYDYLPVLSIKEAVLNSEINQLVKRIFDVFFSLLIIIFILSWLLPLLGVLIKMESKGPVFFKHKRNGINYEEFTCYKFRSLRKSDISSTNHVMEDDSRVTKTGRFIRKTSIDELPQFFNVLFGDMSVVGPRPHMLPFTSAYSKKIDKYRFAYRHSVKPGITGLAQVKGYRGEIKNDEDIINRIKYDIFYIENWSLLLDLKIITQTFFNVIKGEKKAY